jgi:glutathione S-transferase
MIRILGRPNSINVQKVVWIAAELGLEVERLDVGGPFGGNDRPEYLAKNPTGRIPTLEDGEVTMWESPRPTAAPPGGRPGRRGPMPTSGWTSPIP